MSNPILLKIAVALRQANEELYAILKFNVIDHTWEVWVDNKPAYVNFLNYDDAEDKCEELNYHYVARKAVESLKDCGLNYYDDVLNLCLDNILK